MQVEGTEWKFGLIFKSKEKKRKMKSYVAQQRVYFTKKERSSRLYITLPSLHDYDGISCFMEEVNKRRRNITSESLSQLGHGS